MASKKKKKKNKKIELRKTPKKTSSSSKSSGGSSSSAPKVTKSYTTTSGEKVVKYADGSESRSGGSSPSITKATAKTPAQLLSDAQTQLQGIQKGLNEGVASGQIKTNAEVTAEPEILTPESIADAVSGGMGEQAGGYTPTETEEDTFQEGTGTYQTQEDGSAQLVGGQGQAQMTASQSNGQGNLSTPSIVDYLGSVGQASDFNSRKNLAGQYGIQGYTGTAQQNTQLLGALRGAPVTPQEQITPTSAGAVAQTAEQVAPQGGPAQSLAAMSQKFGLTQTQDDFFNDPLKTIGDITKQVFTQMGLGEANSAIKDISEELEDLENDRDDELRAVNEDPWLTEGMRLRQRAKIEEKWSDKIDNRVNKLQLLESVRDDAQQQAQFALGTAISIYDSERRFQADQIQQYYQQAQNEFDNMIKLQQLSAPEKGTSEMQEYLFSIEQGFNGSFLDYKQAIAAAGRAPATSDGYSGPYTKAQLSAITKINESVSKNATYARTASMRGYIDNINAALSQANGLSDIAAINQFQKVIDEGAVTRDQDVVLIQGAQSLANQLNTKVSALQSGQQLGNDQRGQMRVLMQKIYNAQVNALSKDPYVSAKKKEASLYGLTEYDTILGELGGFDTEEDSTSILDNIVNTSQSIYTPPAPTPTVDAGGGFWKSFTKVFGF